MSWWLRGRLLASIFVTCSTVQITHPVGHDTADPLSSDFLQPLIVVDENSTADAPSLMNASSWDPLMRLVLPSLHSQAASHQRDALLCRLKSRFPVAQVQQMFPHSRTCSVVSSSGVMIFHSHGHHIDSAETVLRFNLAPSAGRFGQQVGSKETIRIMNEGGPRRLTLGRLKPDLAVNAVKDLVVIPVVNYPDMGAMQTLRSRYPTKQLKVLPKEIFLASENALRSIYDTAWFERHKAKGVRFDSTSGFVGMLAMLSVCDEVRAFGMAATPRGAQASYHYFDGEMAEADANSNTWHINFQAEKDLWRRMALNPAKLDETDVVEMPGFSKLSC